VKHQLNKVFFGLVLSLVLIVTLVGCAPTAATTPEPTARTITDMYGRQVTVPAQIDRVLATGPIEMQIVYLLAPDKLAGLAFTFNGKPAYAPEKYTSLPVVGGWFGTQTGNYETFIAAGPDIVLEGSQTAIDERQEKLGPIPVVGVNPGNYLTEYEAEITFLGDLLGVPEKAESLLAYYRDAMKYVDGIVSGIPESEKVKVYYAEGKDGFNTDPVGSMHTMLLEFCGGINVADVAIKQGYGMAETSLEQVLLWDPDMIIIGRGSQTTLYQTVTTDTKWGQLKAVQDKKVYLRPDNPLSWFDGPPGVCQIVGMYWMVNKLYPDKTQNLDLKAKVKEFYTNFLHYDLTDDEVSKLLADPA
jgi:iron complex transport system substrate-binding protein